MHYTIKIIAATAVYSLLMANSAVAELLVDPTAKSKMGDIQVSGYYATSTVAYDVTGNGDVNRTILGASAAYGMSDALDVYGSFALINKAETGGFSGDGDGTAIAIGARGALPIQASIKLSGYAQYLMIDEDYGSNLSGKDTTISAGAMASTMMDSTKFYGGIEIILLSDINVDFTGGSDSGKRDDKFTLRAGAVLPSGDIDVNFALALLGEKGFMFGASKNF